jgi:predicted RNase H-like HicB family nuclease
MVVHPIKVASNRKPPHGIGREDLIFSLEIDREEDGRWIAEIPEVPGALAYGASKEEATRKAYAIALRAVADNIEGSQEEPPTSIKWRKRAIA